MPDRGPSEPPDVPSWSPYQVGFYVCCAIVGIGATVAAFVLVMFPDATFTPSLATFGVVLVVTASFGSWRCLRLARGEG
ncbi:MAG: hypothetical protein AAF628_37770 [Planctomycetota bacterium]